VCGSDDDEDASRCAVVMMMRMVVSVCGSDRDVVSVSTSRSCLGLLETWEGLGLDLVSG